MKSKLVTIGIPAFREPLIGHFADKRVSIVINESVATLFAERLR